MTAAEMKHGWSRWGMGWLWLACSLVASAEEGLLKSPGQWLDAMVDAMQHLNYQATVVYSRDNRIRLFKLAHQVRDGVIYEHLHSLSDPMRKVVRKADKISCYFPERKTLVEYHHRSDSLFASLPSRWKGQDKFYRLELGGTGHMVSRPSREILIRPLDDYRYGRRLWIDTETHLPLKLELLDQQDNVLESLAVTDLKVGAEIQPESDDHSHEGWTILDRKEEEPQQRWRLTRLPEGFRELRRSRRLDPVEGMPVDHVLISDGVATVSVYIKENDGHAFNPTNLKRGGVSVYRRITDGYVITVVGDVPVRTVRMIGQGLELKNEGGDARGPE